MLLEKLPKASGGLLRWQASPYSTEREVPPNSQALYRALVSLGMYGDFSWDWALLQFDYRFWALCWPGRMNFALADKTLTLGCCSLYRLQTLASKTAVT
jgi:hypothetical protein